jgi:uncharacterized protein YkwD
MKKVRWLILVIELLLLGWIWQNRNNLKNIVSLLLKDQKNEPEQVVYIGNSKIPFDEMKVVEMETVVSVVPSPILIKKRPVAKPTVDNEPWGVAKQVDEVTWTMKVGEDEKMATAQEIFEALNEYRRIYGSQTLTWDEKLGNYAQSRAEYLNSIKNVDKHEGFNNFMENEDGFNKLGFTALGENISYGYKLNGVHVIEWMYAGDEPHDNNQLDNRWNYVGIGVDELATCLIFGTGKM